MKTFGTGIWNRRGIILEPLQVMADPLVVTMPMPELEEDAGAGNTETGNWLETLVGRGLEIIQ